MSWAPRPAIASGDVGIAIACSLGIFFGLVVVLWLAGYLV